MRQKTARMLKRFAREAASGDERGSTAVYDELKKNWPRRSHKERRQFRVRSEVLFKTLATQKKLEAVGPS